MSTAKEKRAAAEAAIPRIRETVPDLVGVYLVNSVAAGDCDPDSDVDLLAISEETERRETFECEGETIDLGVFPMQAVERSLDDLLERDFHAWKIAHAEILRDPSARLAVLQQKWNKRSKKLDAESFGYHIESAVAYAKQAADRAADGRLGEGHNALQTAAVRLWSALHPLCGVYRRDQAPNLAAFEGQGALEGLDLSPIADALGLDPDGKRLDDAFDSLEGLLNEMEKLAREMG